MTYPIILTILLALSVACGGGGNGGEEENREWDAEEAQTTPVPEEECHANEHANPRACENGR